MPLDYDTLNQLRRNHPAWRLLCAQHAPLVATFLHRVFVAPNERVVPQADLVEKLEDQLFTLREQQGAGSFPHSAQTYLNDWAENDKGWLRKFYPPGNDEPHFSLTPATDKALSWLEGLTKRAFVGTESRLLTLFELLRQMDEGSQQDPQQRIAELQKRRAGIDDEIARILSGDIPLLDDTALKDRFQQFQQMARDLLADFSEVEENFRILNRQVRERIALRGAGDGNLRGERRAEVEQDPKQNVEGLPEDASSPTESKRSLLEDIMAARDTITDSDQGRSFRAFWDFLMSDARQQELRRLLERVLSLPPIVEMAPEKSLRYVYNDWLTSADHTQQTVRTLSQQLRKFLDDQAWLENRRIMEILRNIERHALALHQHPPSADFMPLADHQVRIHLPLERPFYRPPVKPLIVQLAQELGDADVDTTMLYTQIAIDRAELMSHIRQQLQERQQITLADLIRRCPLRHGLAELMVYLQLASEWPQTVVDEQVEDKVSWQLEAGTTRQVTLPRIILLRS